MHNVCAIITEYNPFHYGHEYNIQIARRITGCSKVIVIMSGPFMQRGEPAIVDKWSRANMALNCGADMVIELPCAYAVQSADWFAYGALEVIKSLNCVSHLVFGSETCDTKGLIELAKCLYDEPKELSKLIKEYLKLGVSHPSAISSAIHDYLGEQYSQLLKTPNNTLGLMYLKAMLTLDMDIIPHAVKRIGSEYNDTKITSKYASATAIRKAISENNNWQDSVPEFTREIIEELMNKNAGPVDYASFKEKCMFSLVQNSKHGIDRLPDMSEGLNNRIFEGTRTGNYDEFLSKTKSKRYPMARIKRAALHSYLGIISDDMNAIRHSLKTFAFVLGVRRDSIDLLSYISKNASSPIITQPGKQAPDSLLWDINTRAQDLYALINPNPAFRVGAKDYTNRMLIVD